LPRAALWGALAYMAAPYHLLDHYYRGAYAEFAAYVVLPLVMLAVRLVAEGRPLAVAALAAAYAALAMVHLPTALLVSLTVLPLYVLHRGWRLGEPRTALAFFARCAMAGVSGLGLAAIYLLPALTLQDWISPDRLWSSDYQVDRWFLLTPQRWPPAGVEMNWIIASFAGGYALAVAGILLMVAHGKAARLWRSESAFWAITCLLCLLLIAGVVPWFWQVPFVAKVQFPWRLMIVVEFAGISALAWAPWSVRLRPARIVFAAALAAFIPGLASMAEGIVGRAQLALAGQVQPPADVKEYLPAGYPQKPQGGYAELSLDPLQGLPTISCTPQPRLCQADGGAFGALRVEIDGDAPAAVVIRRFAYPYWQLEPPLPIVASDPLRLVSFTVPAGRHVYRLHVAAVPAEKLGWAISGVSILLVLGWVAAGRRGART